MEQWIQETRQILQRSPTGALPLSEILEELRRSGIHLASRDRWLLAILEERTETFGVVRIPRGPWALQTRTLEEIAILQDPWIVLKEVPERRLDGEEVFLGRVREGIRAWGEFLDQGSPSEVARWIRANLEGTLACRAFLSGSRPGR